MRLHPTHPSSIALLMLLSASLEACSEDPAPQGDSPSEPTPSEDATPTPIPTLDGQTLEAATLQTEAEAPLLYVVDWSWDGADWDDAEQAYVFTTDLGYVVGLEAAYVSTWSLEMVDCANSQTGTTARAARRLQPASTPPGAPERSSSHRLDPAHHSENPDASQLAAPVVESAYDEETREFGVAPSSGLEYCQIHVLMVPMAATADDGFPMESWSAYVRGWYIAPGQTERQDMEATVNLSDGANIDLYRVADLYQVDAIVAADGTEAQARITVTRNAARAFDGMDLAAISSVELAYEFQQGVGHTAIAVYEVPAPATP